MVHRRRAPVPRRARGRAPRSAAWLPVAVRGTLQGPRGWQAVAPLRRPDRRAWLWSDRATRRARPAKRCGGDRASPAPTDRRTPPRHLRGGEVTRVPRPEILPDPSERFVVVEASAGTGKTFFLEHRVVDLILAGAQLPEILLVTFTDKAVAELRLRIRDLLDRLSRADT